jgi:ATP-dependent helicase HrpA
LSGSNALLKLIAARRARLPRLVYPPALPILDRREEIVAAIRKHPVVIITGETGSGKTTQIPKMCLEAGRGLTGQIACTQPRRIAATSVAMRIAEELGEEVGQSVGYKIRFDERTRRNAFIKIMTDGILLMETQRDPILNAYDTIIVDEAHERSLNIDFILGILKTILPRRRDLRVIITSATIDTGKFSKAFHDAPIIEVSGRLYPVEVRYLPIDPKLEETGEVTPVEAAVRAVDELIERRERGDILIFMPTEQDGRPAPSSPAA